MTDDLEDHVETARKLFAQPCDFVAGADQASALPDATLPEIAFAGRSNVGKSSLVNALTGRRTLARTSRTPGRTQQLNFFDLGHRLQIVDMPGYGYAAVGKDKVSAWTELARAFLRGRATLLRTYVLIDGRHGLKPVDLETLAVFDRSAVSYAVILTKADAVKPTDLETTRQNTEAALATRPAAFPHVLATSADTGQGIPELRGAVLTLLHDRGG